MDVGQEWAFRLRDSAPSERVRVIAIREGKRSSRVDLEFLDHPDAPPVEDLPAGRLRVPWSEVVAFDERMAAWDRLADEDITEVESDALDLPFQLIPPEVATEEWKPVRYATAVYDSAAFTLLTGLELAAVETLVATYEHDGVTYLSPTDSVLVAQSLCRLHSETVLSQVETEERDFRRRCMSDWLPSSIRAGLRDSSPEREWETYLRYYRPVHELLRQWCGHRAVTVHERLLAAENEVVRLDGLIARMLDHLRDRGPNDHAIEVYEREVSQEQITPHNVRATASEPIPFDQVPVRVEYRRRRWG